MTKEDYAGDDLNDGLEYEIDLSDAPEQGGIPHGALESEDEIAEASEIEDNEVAKLSTEAKAGKKRKATDSKLKEKKKMKMEIDLEQKKSISKESSTEVIADYINKTVAQKNKKLSSLELSDLYISKNDIRSTSEIEGPRNLEGLASYLNTRFKNMLPAGKKGKRSGNDDERKFIVIISMSAIRACDVYRSTKNLNGSSIKLINKNKIAADIKLLQVSKSRVFCCTPTRLKKVCEHEENVLNKKEVKIVILDNSYLDQKGQNIWDIPETIQVLKELTDNGAKVYLY
ncbi:hypothetical protein PSN45_001810 [Yamadazyma tenuis]|uniref:Protein CMS1 n=1 Tax=Candida tenuis (strain ATCC 10573 / BCRC 21748 / CBS 615 / JCM 9827 / NBRC 10315 / NRRL Y-1498 / VKM Y-70) TaxID=590646 RepID=G3BE08_CANTC|nr:uncharacterized protein CANTEDRAFT_116469 [Yamadazyma tenuis ATCC 10573]EGV60428.1 hypothetical protein CANTEDRAFT_116469 [Yamadazyma tenuis ATCC 10573]WEJ94326.1 hypothetical protein PSN45_001810 [Yamadazyma tenuis]